MAERLKGKIVGAFGGVEGNRNAGHICDFYPFREVTACERQKALDTPPFGSVCARRREIEV